MCKIEKLNISLIVFAQRSKFFSLGVMIGSIGSLPVLKCSDKMHKK